MSGKICRGEMYYADLDPVVGLEQGRVRPVLIIQNNIGNLYSPTVVVAALSGKVSAKNRDAALKKEFKLYPFLAGIWGK